MRLFILLMMMAVAAAQTAKKIWPSDSVAFKPNWDIAFDLSNSTFDNWYQAGNDAFNWQVATDYDFSRETATYILGNRGKFAFGKTQLDGVSNPTRKSSDQIKHETVATYKAGWFVNPFISVSAETQFTTGFEYTDSTATAISDFLDPGYFTQAVGIGFISPEKEFTLRAGLSFKQTVTDEFRTYTDPDNLEETFRFDTGLKLNSVYKKKFSDSFHMDAALEVFSTLQAIDQTDIYLDLKMVSKLNSFLHMSFDLNFRFDPDFSDQRQIKHILSIGLFYDIIE